MSSSFLKTGGKKDTYFLFFFLRGHGSTVFNEQAGTLLRASRVACSTLLDRSDPARAEVWGSTMTLKLKPVGRFVGSEPGKGIFTLASWLGDESGESFSGLEPGRRVWLLWRLEDAGEWSLSKKMESKSLGLFAGRSFRL